jgi:hypothetical protein
MATETERIERQPSRALDRFLPAYDEHEAWSGLIRRAWLRAVKKRGERS